MAAPNRPTRDSRPSPEALLAQAVKEARGRLKIFLGAAPGVGKTYEMLQAAQAKRREGVDVVVGVVETHGRAETQALLAELETVPRRRIDYKGRVLDEMDLDAILARRPKLVLVDELAHTNAPGARHPKRYLDVEELLNAGIDVYTTLNIQHVESLNDVVAQITRIRVRETVPDGMLDRADDIEVVDLSPDDLALPRLIDLRIDPAAPPDLAALKSALAAAAPGAVLDDHRLWLDSLLRFGRAVELTALLILTLIASVAILSVMFTTRTGLAVHRESIELLHVMGARDGYIARQFEREALRLGLIGGLIGLAVAGATLLALGHAANAAAIFGDTVTLLPALHLRGWNWAAIAALPPAAAFIAMLTARVTVMLTLLRLP